ncbi:MAG: biotin-dependent carboxyltransferase [Planctomycetes bacterium]|nr:biotin-dependent carboxyltransferase [Planctomycetota bacterium]
MPAIATLTILSPGLYTLLVDRGRPRTRSLGVPVGGAADAFSLALGNALVGNPPDAPALEVCLSGPVLCADEDLACVLFGAPFELNAGGRRLAAGKTFTLLAGEELSIHGTSERARAYLCIGGGIDGPEVLGSRSSLQPVVAGAELPCRRGTIMSRFLRSSFEWNAEPGVLRFLPGAQAEWFSEDRLTGQEFTITPASNRMGLRLHAEPLGSSEREIVSEPVCPGSVQVTRDGQCIVLGVDGQTIGGYPKIAQVIAADLDKLGQLRPGERARFRRVSVEEAEDLYRRKRRELQEWLVRLYVAERRKER